jgi:hypothetical protein
MANDDKAARLAAALRTNLKRRKEQARAQPDAAPSPPSSQRASTDPAA